MEPTVQHQFVTRLMGGIDGCRQQLLWCTCCLALRFGLTDAWRPLHTKQANHAVSGAVRITGWPRSSVLVCLTLSGLPTVPSRQCGAAHGMKQIAIPS